MLNLKGWILVVCVAAVVLCCGNAKATVITKYTFDNSSPEADITVGGIVATTFESYLNRATKFVDGNPNSGKAFEDTGWTLGNYFHFSLTVAEGYQLNIASLQFDHKKEASAVSGWEVSYRVGNGGPFITMGTGPSDNTSWISAIDDLSGAPSLQNISDTIFFRIKGNGSSNDKKKWDVDNVTLTGDVQFIPEPATIVLLGLGAFALLKKRR